MNKQFKDFKFGGIYFLQYADLNSITKIGFATYLRTRLYQYKVGSPCRVLKGYVIKYKTSIEMLSYIESRFHSYFSQYYSHGEWYNIPQSFNYEDFFDSINVEYYYFEEKIPQYNKHELHENTATHKESIENSLREIKNLEQHYKKLNRIRHKD